MRNAGRSLLAGLLLLGCATPAETEPPLPPGFGVTGYFIRTEQLPDGRFVCGQVPELETDNRFIQSLDRVGMVPNPYSGYSAYEVDSLRRVVRFFNLPTEAHIEIKKSFWGAFSYGSSLPPVTADIGRTVRTFTKSSRQAILRWDLKDNEGRHVPSGFYQAYVRGRMNVGDSAIVYNQVVNLYIVQREDLDAWVDYTGCNAVKKRRLRDLRPRPAPDWVAEDVPVYQQ